jgi:hypothetical protein
MNDVQVTQDPKHTGSSDETIRFYLHGKAKQAEVLTALESDTLAAVLARFDALPEHGQVVFVGEADEALRTPDEAEDEQAPAALDATLKALGLRKLRHVHTRAVHRVEVTVHFNGKHRQRRFSPAATVATLLEWAKSVFKIDPTGGADLVLSLRPEGIIPRPEQHLGELLELGSTALEFDLVREQTPQG